MCLASWRKAISVSPLVQHSSLISILRPLNVLVAFGSRSTQPPNPPGFSACNVRPKPQNWLCQGDTASWETTACAPFVINQFFPETLFSMNDCTTIKLARRGPSGFSALKSIPQRCRTPFRPCAFPELKKSHAASAEVAICTLCPASFSAAKRCLDT